MLDKDTFFNKIEEMTLCTKDYDTAMLLMNNLPTKLFVKILEEILEGNLSWEDFDQYLTKSESYKATFKESIEMQSKMVEDITKILQLRQLINEWLRKMKQPELNIINTKRICITEPIGIDSTEEDKKLYDREVENYTLGMIYSALKIRPTDTEIEKEFKAILFNNLENGLYYKKYANSKNITISRDGILKDEKGEEFSYILPEELLFSADKLMVPVQYEYQILNESDKEYMKVNGLNEADMKKLKATAELLRIGGGN